MKMKTTLDIKKQKVLLKKAVQRDPENIKMVFAYCKLCQQEDENTGGIEEILGIDRTLRSLEQIIKLNPNCELIPMYGKICIQTNNSKRGLDTLIKALDRKPFSTIARAMIAYIEQKTLCSTHKQPLYNIRRDIRTYNDPDIIEFVDKFERSVKSGFQCCSMPSKLIKTGMQYLLKDQRYRHMDELESIINSKIEKFTNELCVLSHPEITPPLPQYELNIWVVLLEEMGYIRSHVHNEGWISGVMYIKVPKDNGSEAGYFEIGSRPIGLDPLGDTLRIKPKPGLMVLFPSYYYHRTIPTTTNEERISLSFDLIIKE